VKFLESILPQKGRGPRAAAPVHDSRAIANIFVGKPHKAEKILSITQLVKLVIPTTGNTTAPLTTGISSDIIKSGWKR